MPSGTPRSFHNSYHQIWLGEANWCAGNIELTSPDSKLPNYCKKQSEFPALVGTAFFTPPIKSTTFLLQNFPSVYHNNCIQLLERFLVVALLKCLAVSVEMKLWLLGNKENLEKVFPSHGPSKSTSPTDLLPKMVIGLSWKAIWNPGKLLS